jgi:hypothetical protein
MEGQTLNWGLKSSLSVCVWLVLLVGVAGWCCWLVLLVGVAGWCGWLVWLVLNEENSIFYYHTLYYCMKTRISPVLNLMTV